MSRNRQRNQNRNNTQKDGKPNVNETKSANTRGSAVFENLKFDASNIYFSNLVGTEIARSASTGLKYLPGFLIYNSMANFVSRSDMINVSATSIYTYVRHANSGRTNYEKSDLMLYLLAMSEIFVGIQELIRAYGFANYFRARNLYSGHLLSALNFDPEELRSNLANARYEINLILNKVKAFAVPKTFSYFEERLSEYAHIYLDEDSPTGQMLFNVPSVLYEFDAWEEETGGKLVPRPWSGHYLEWSERITALNQMLDKLRRNEDINIMSGDILKAYGDNLFNLGPIPIDYEQEPVYDVIQLHQYQNAHVAPGLVPSDLVQEDNKLTTKLTIDTDPDDQFLVGTQEFRLLNSATTDIDANLIFSLSKYQVVSSGLGTEASPAIIASANTTILYSPSIHYFNTSNNMMDSHTVKQWFTGEVVDYKSISLLTKFKHPTYLYSMDYGIPVIGDMHYVAKLSREDTHRMNDTRFILAFQTPQMG